MSRKPVEESDLGEFESDWEDCQQSFVQLKVDGDSEKSSSSAAKCNKEDDAMTLPCDDKRFPANKSKVNKSSMPETRPSPKLSLGDKHYYRTFKKTRGIKLTGVDANIPLDMKLDPPPYSCFACWDRGHGFRHCPSPKISLFCNNCGRRDVDLQECPRCREAYYRERAQAANGNKAAKAPKGKRDPLLEVSMFVNAEGSVAGDISMMDIIDEEFELQSEFTRNNLLTDVERLMETIKHLSVKTQELVLAQWIDERKKIYCQLCDD